MPNSFRILPLYHSLCRIKLMHGAKNMPKLAIAHTFLSTPISIMLLYWFFKYRYTAFLLFPTCLRVSGEPCMPTRYSLCLQPLCMAV